MTFSATAHQTVEVWQILHVYEGMESSYTVSFNDLNSVLHTISWNFNEANTVAGSTIETSTVAHAATFTARTSTGTTDGKTPPQAGFVIGGWHTTPGGDGTNTATGNFGFGTALALFPRTFYATWVASALEFGVNFTWTIADLAASATPNNPQPISLAAIEAGGTATFALNTIPGLNNPSTNVWTFGSTTRENETLVLTLADMSELTLEGPTYTNGTLLVQVQLHITDADSVTRWYTANFTVDLIP
jgi:hypothetical protein